jgi:hypothetical protein
MKVTSHTGQHISPGFHEIKTTRVEIKQVWFMGFLAEETSEVINETHGMQVPEPSKGQRDLFAFADRTWEVVRDDDPTFWGEGLTKSQWLAGVEHRNRAGIQQGWINGWWDLDSKDNPQQLAVIVSIEEMALSNKTLMAHLMVDIGLFSSVNQAKKNGWDKPLQLGRHELGPKKKRTIVEIIE